MVNYYIWEFKKMNRTKQFIIKSTV